MVIVIVKIMISSNIMPPLPPYPAEHQTKITITGEQQAEIFNRMMIAKDFFNKRFVEDNGKIMLSNYLNQSIDIHSNQTNSEAVSYYLLWNAILRDKPNFDRTLSYVNQYMINQKGDYLMWRLENDNKPVTDGSNIASDADLRLIKALLIAEQTWKDKKYTVIINRLSKGLSKVAVSKDGYFLPYGGVTDNGDIWQANEIWLSYSDYSVYEQLYLRNGFPWDKVYYNMKNATLRSQDSIGLYDPVYDRNSFKNSMETGYSINSLWIMTRNAESNDPELRKSAEKSLEFYINQYSKDNKLYISYNSDGTSSQKYESPWVYSLVARSAIMLDNSDFSNKMINEMLKFQDTNPRSQTYGGFLEGSQNGTIISQFTMQESILTMQSYLQASEFK